MGRWNCTSSGIESRSWATPRVSRSSTAGSLGRPWSKRRSLEASSGSGTATQLDDGKGQPSKRDDERHGKAADGKGLVAAGADTRRAWWGLENVGQEQERGDDPRSVQKGRQPLPMAPAPEEQGHPNDQPEQQQQRTT